MTDNPASDKAGEPAGDKAAEPTKPAPSGQVAMPYGLLDRQRPGAASEAKDEPEVLTLSREVVGGVGMTPGEARFIGKMLGKPMKGWGDIDDVDQFQVSIFLALARRHPEEEKAVLWERAENTPARFAAEEEEEAAPPIDPLAGFGEERQPPPTAPDVDPLPDEGSEA